MDQTVRATVPSYSLTLTLFIIYCKYITIDVILANLWIKLYTRRIHAVKPNQPVVW